MTMDDRKLAVEKQLSSARLRLLDLTMRNRLLNYYSTKRRSVEIINEDPFKVFDRLVIDEKAFTFRAQFDDADSDYDDAETPLRFDFEENNDKTGIEKEQKKAIDNAEPITPETPGEVATEPVQTELDGAVNPQETRVSGHFLEIGDAPDRSTPDIDAQPKRFVEPPPLTNVEVGTKDSQSLNQQQTLEADQATKRYKDFISQGVWTGAEPAAQEEQDKQDTYLLTPYGRNALDRKLFFVNHEAHSILEEQGYNVLHLAIGLLEWYETDNNEIARLAPIVLLPVELYRNRIGGVYSIRWNGDDPIGNISLIEKLKEQFVEIPEFVIPESNEEEKTYLTDYFTLVSKAVAKKTNWKLHLNLNMDFFSFTKFVMYKDLDPVAWPAGRTPAEHILILELFSPTRTMDDLQKDEGFPENEIDIRLTARDMHHIRDADPSQIAVIEDIKKGRNLVVEGPPGTGKSQTITNAISELLFEGKSVLFVSEKMAALEVVKSRLDDAGLGDFCLEIHSNKANKREVLREIARVASLEPQKSESLDNELNRHTALRDELDLYASILRTNIGQAGFTLWKLYNERLDALLKLDERGGKAPRIAMGNAQECNIAMYNEARDALDDIVQLVPSMGDIPSHPWRGFSPDVVTPDIEREIGEVIATLAAKLAEIIGLLNDVSNTLPVNPSKKLSDAESAIHSAILFSDVPKADQQLLNGDTWNEKPSDVDRIIAEIADFTKLRSYALEKMNPSALEVEIGETATKFSVMHRSLLRFINPTYYSIKKKALTMYTVRRKVTDTDIARDLVLLSDVMVRRKKIRSYDRRGKELFGTAWDCENSDETLLDKLSKWLTLFRKLVLNQTLTEKAADFVLNKPHTEMASKCSELATRTQNVLNEFTLLYERFCELTKPNFTRLFSSEKSTVPLGELSVKLATLTGNMSLISRWSRYAELERIVERTCAAPVLSAFEEGKLQYDDLDSAFRFNFAESLLEFAIKTNNALAMFDRDLHEGKIKRFADLERTIISKGRKKLVSELSAKRPRITGGGIPGTALGVLTKEMAKKRGHIPLRRLFSLSGELIQKIKPCFMMSPLSVAQFLDPTTARFDVIIFDEASQVRPEDALGALLRGTQLVVMGDDKQLPPTSFFDRVVDPADEQLESEEYIDSSTGLESILGLAKTAFPCKPLKWHYRSRHESLIAVSNYRFYDNMLWIYPSPVRNPEEMGLSIVHLPETVYDRGKSKTNKLEAAAVVKAAVEHFKLHSEKSLGIGTFSISQQQAILMEVERVIRENPDLEPYFQTDKLERFFVKNLETIQGDERDVIFISVGYGKDKDGKLSMNFGPLNHAGGERRLNVLITRAREKCVVFANFKADDLRIGATSEGTSISEQGGVAALKQFLKFAETRILEDTSVSQKTAESPFEKSVQAFLESNGSEVHSQVGCAGFRVDLGVVSPLSQGRYVAGIECDGWKYHSSPVARDRDRLRQQVLENLGWRIIRIWSTDWYRSRDEAEKRLLAELNSAIEDERDKSSASATAKPVAPVPAPNESAESAQESVSSESDTKPAGRKAASKNDYGVIDYEVCESFGISRRKDIVDTPVEQLAIAVAKTVEIEWPIHVSEVLRRLREHWKLSRSGSRIEEQIKSAINVALRQGTVLKLADFLYIPSFFSAANPVPIRVRKRDLNPKPDVELIAPEEVEAAMKIVITEQYAIFPEDLIKQAAYLLGFKAVSEQTRSKMQQTLDDALNKSRLHLKANGMVELVEK